MCAAFAHTGNKKKKNHKQHLASASSCAMADVKRQNTFIAIRYSGLDDSISLESKVEVGRAFYYTRPKAFFIYVPSRAQARARIKPDLFSKVFKPEKARAQSMKPEPDPSPKNQARSTST
jgi:hypothetical protein